MKTILLTFTLITFITSPIAMSKETKKQIIEAATGPVTLTTTTKDAPEKEPEIEKLPPKQMQEVSTFSAQAKTFLSTYLPKEKVVTLQNMDEAFRLWQVEKKQKYTEEQVAKIVGSWLGNKLCQDFKMEWVSVSDEEGTTVAVRSTEKEVMSHPFDSVWKRIDNNEYDFIEGVYLAVKSIFETSELKSR